jgi:hypothetical protein
LSSVQTKCPPPSPPKPSTSNWRKSLLINPDEQESISTDTDPIYGNVHVSQRIKKKEISIDDEADLIEHDLLDLVEQEQKKEQQNTPPELPIKKRAGTTTAITTIQENTLDVEIEPTMKLAHPGNNKHSLD